MISVRVFMGISSIICVVLSTPLDDYVKALDSHYSYEPLVQHHKENYTIHILNMTSQKWMDEKYTNHPIWWHYVIIVVPKELRVKDTAFLLIDAGHNHDKVPDETDLWLDLVIVMAVTTKTIAVSLKQVPNQPIVFKSDPNQHSRSEDSLLGWSWREFLQDPDRPQTLVHLAMTKAAVRAMDTIDDYSRKTWNQGVDKFFVAGASKRGWTTWLTSAVDSRVIGMAPIVFDLLSMEAALHHHIRSLGGWTFAFEPYYLANITHLLGTPNFHKSTEIFDPLAYKDRYKMPIYIIKAAGDEFFLLDETMFFYNQLTGPHWLRVLPNCEHTMVGQIGNTILGIRSFYLHLLQGATYPKVTWTMTSSASDGKIRVTMNTTPLSVTMFMAKTLPFDKRRDFRLFKRNPKTGGTILHPVVWFKGDVTKITSKEYEASVKIPLKGWRAFFIEVTFKGVEDSVLAFSTEVNIVPNTLPFPACTTNCTGILV